MDATQDRIREAVTRRAAEWFVAHREGPLSTFDREAFAQWLRESPLNVREYLAIASAARDLQSASDYPGVELQRLIEDSRALPDDTVTVLERSGYLDERDDRDGRRQRVRFVRAARWAVAAGLMAIIVFASPWLLHEVQRLAGRETLRTVHGEQRVWRLADGSVVHLNSESELKVHFTETERTLEIARGQVMFEVTKERRHFSVLAGQTRIVAVGTAFDVHRKSDATVVTVIEGRVAVYRGTGSDGRQEAVRPALASLEAGQQIRVTAGSADVIDDGVDLVRASAWTQQQIVFHEERLADVAEEFNRYGRVPIRIEDPVLADLRITGTFSAYDTESFLAFVDRLKGVEVRIEKDVIRAVGAGSSVEGADAMDSSAETQPDNP